MARHDVRQGMSNVDTGSARRGAMVRVRRPSPLKVQINEDVLYHQNLYALLGW